ncbi:MAG TPA: hydroxyisourate hydrolase [Bacteroidia bacterium]|nr:hydroxyisourate hydrolase [Bacteroidia bacterium]HNP98540.1 hydroxyisourate hydrolase [Bacteroidia bacterium]
MSQITTHILDTSKGLPASGIKIVFEKSLPGDKWMMLGNGITNQDGRISDLLKADAILDPGMYRMTFETAPYFAAQQLQSFYPFVQLVFEIKDTKHYHIPLLLSPYGFTTYRGS